MATWVDVRRLVTALPETDEHSSHGGHPSWRVHQKMFVWERPLSRADRAALADAAPSETEPLLGVRVADEGVKTALITDDPGVFFTTPHFDGYAAVLVRLERIPVNELAELVEDAWRLRAPKRLLADFDRHRG
ncbi:MAG: MmcQ/YjbR family DNA-binding protein [Geodermatophilaceae bacterium]|nr:MmcQ/YjbR family DNA-binding protein [Geodermatophilaceae bacterium]